MNKKQLDRQLVDDSICGLESRLEQAFKRINDINDNLNEAIVEQNNKHQMLLDYLKLEEYVKNMPS